MLQNPTQLPTKDHELPAKKEDSKMQKNSLSFSSAKSGAKPLIGKRKAVVDVEGDPNDSVSKVVKKKAKKASKTLLSFGDDA